jgi:MSHA biogenesis protein MshL
MLEVVEGSAQRQVFIQAKILEVTLKDEYRLGIDWSRISPLTVTSSAEGAGTFLGSLKNATLTGASPFTFGLANANFNLIVNALSQQGEVNVLSNPKIATLNNQRAVIKVGTEDVFFLPQTTAATTTTAAVTTFTVESVTIGIVLDVVPQISSDGGIMMSINTSITEQNGTRTTPDGITSVPILDIREASNVVLADNGQTIVLGGLMKTKSEDKDNSLPLLGEIPIVGRLFQYKDRTQEKSELIIMLTPQIMVGKAVDEEKAKELAMLGRKGITTPNDPPWGPKSRVMR